MSPFKTTINESSESIYVTKQINHNAFAIISGYIIFSAKVCIRLYLACAIHYNHFQTLGSAHISSTDFVNKRDKVFKVKLQINFHLNSMLFTYSMQTTFIAL